MSRYYGTVYHQIDEKFRVRVPSKFFPTDDGEELDEKSEKEDRSGKKLSLMAGAQGCIAVYRREVLDARVDEHVAKTPENGSIYWAKRKIFSSIEQVETDRQGRIVLPAKLRDYAKIGKELVSIGMDDHFEIWAKEIYDEQDKAMSYERAFSEFGLF